MSNYVGDKGRPAEAAPQPPAGWRDIRKTQKMSQDWLGREGVREAGEPVIAGEAMKGKPLLPVPPSPAGK